MGNLLSQSLSLLHAHEHRHHCAPHMLPLIAHSLAFNTEHHHFHRRHISFPQLTNTWHFYAFTIYSCNSAFTTKKGTKPWFGFSASVLLVTKSFTTFIKLHDFLELLYFFFYFLQLSLSAPPKKPNSLSCGCKKYSIRTLIIVQPSTFWANPEVLSGRLGNIVPPACPRLSLGPPPSVTYPINLTREASRGHPNKKLEPPCLAPCDAEESECRPLVSVLPCCLSLPRVLEHGWRQDVDRWVNQEHFCSAASSPWRAGAKSASLLKRHWFTWPSQATFFHHWRDRPLVGLLHLGQDLIPDLERAPHAFLAEERGLRCWVSSQQLHTLLQTASVRAENDSWSIMKPTETHIL